MFDALYMYTYVFICTMHVYVSSLIYTMYVRFCIRKPKKCHFGEPYYINQFSGQKRRKVSVTDKFYYVPLLPTLKGLMELHDFQHEIFYPHPSEPENVLGDFCDGTLSRSHSLFNTSPNALQVIAYYDELG